MKTKRELYAELRKMMDELKPHLDKVRDFARQNKLMIHGAEVSTLNDYLVEETMTYFESKITIDEAYERDDWFYSSLDCGAGYSV